MGEVQLSAEQAQTVAMWSATGPDMAAVVVVDLPPRYARFWQEGDVLRCADVGLSRTYNVALRAELAAPYFVRLRDPEVVAADRPGEAAA